MLEALLLAVELNGQQLSRGSLVLPMDANRCQVERAALQDHLRPEALIDFLAPADDSQILVDHQLGRCEIEPDAGLARLTIPARFLKAKPIQLGQARDPSGLMRPLFSTASPFSTIPSLALDFIGGSAHQAIGLVASRGPHQLQARRSWASGQAVSKMVLESIQESGAVFRLGDQAVTTGRSASPTEWRGLSWSSEHAALATPAAARGEFELEGPARIRFFDQQGQQVFSDRLLAPGRYSLEGFGAPSQPGLLRIEVVDLDGERRQIELPWVSSPRLLEADQERWGLLLGETQQLTLERGLSAQETLRLGHHQGHRAGRESWVGIASRRITGVLADLSLAQICRPACHLSPEALLSLRPFSNWPRLDLQVRMSREGSQLAAQTPLGDQTSLSLIARANDQRLQLSRRLGPTTQLGLQVHQTGEPRTISLSLQLSLSLDDRLSLSLSGQLRSDGRTGYAASLQRQSDNLEGDSLQLNQQTDEVTSQSFGLRSARRFGDLSVLASRRIQPASGSEQTQLSGQVSSRLWVTQAGLHWGPVGPHNLVVHDLGLRIPTARMRQGEDLSRVANPNGQLVFSRTPTWTTTRYQLDQRQLPFWLSWRGGALDLPLTSQRAYRISHSENWVTSLSMRLDLSARQIQEIETIRDAEGRLIHWLPDGYVDLQDSRRLPLRITLQSGLTMPCGEARQTPDEEGQLLARCTRPRQTPRLASANEGHVGGHERHELNVGL